MKLSKLCKNIQEIREAIQADPKQIFICCDSCHSTRPEDRSWVVFKTGKSALVCCTISQDLHRYGLVK